MVRNMGWAVGSACALIAAGSAWIYSGQVVCWQSWPVPATAPGESDLPDDRTAPDFDLAWAYGPGRFRLHDYRGHKPVALIFGSYTCPFIRSSADELQSLYEKYGDDVQFCFVYTRELHTDEWPIPQNEAEGVRLTQTHTIEERRARCVESFQKMKLSMPAAVDDLDDTVAKAYDSSPTIRMHLIDRSGQVVYRSHGFLPLSFNPGEFESAIVGLLDGQGTERVNDS